VLLCAKQQYEASVNLKIKSDEGPEKTLLPSFSLVIEWENAHLAEMHNTRDMLRELFQQLEQEYSYFSSHPEIIFLCDPKKIPFELIERVVEETCPTKDKWAKISTVASPGLRYYEMKNLGAKHAHGDVVLFLDSDVVPEDGWLRHMLTPFLKPEVAAITGNTYVPPNSTKERAYALFWMFPLRSEEGPLKPTVRGFANNLACRLDVFRATGFPDNIEFRWHTGPLLQSLSKQGYGVFHQPMAHVRHPPPESLHHFLSRALCEGHDVYLNRNDGSNDPRVMRPAIWYIVSELKNFHRYRHYFGAKLGLARAALPKAYAITFIFNPNYSRRGSQSDGERRLNG
jgi:hypothetical protein